MKYIAHAVVAFAAGAELGLNKDQAGARRHALTEHPKRKGWFVATGPIQLKAGEEFQYDGDLPKGMADVLEAAQKSRSGKTEAEAIKAAALVAAEQALSAAMATLAAADDDAKPAAQKAVDEAEAALEAIKS